MENRNFEPLLILAVTALFLVFMGFAFPESWPAPRTVPEKAAETPPAPAASDSLPALPAAKGPGIRPATDPVRSGDVPCGMEDFFEALRQLSSEPGSIHIAYFGDSMIEGDLVTLTLREFLQRRFGGRGVGFVPVTTPLPGFRTTIRQSFSQDWNPVTFVKRAEAGPIQPGPSGYAYPPVKGAWTRFQPPGKSGAFRSATLIYGGTSGIELSVKTDTTIRPVSLTATQPVQTVRLGPDTLFSSLQVTTGDAGPGNVLYGVNFESGPGVYVDNYAFRGCSGLPLGNIPPGILSGFNKALNNKLLILHYGLNVYSPEVEDYHWYEEAMGRVIRHLKAASPGVSILVVSMPDRAALIGGEYFTPAGLPDFIRMQQRVATRENVAFFNLYEAMGGANSMKKWAEERPRLAGDDYTHPNGAGAARIASLIGEFLMNTYDHSRPAATPGVPNPLQP